MSKIQYILIILFLFSLNQVYSQVDTTHPNYKKFSYENGQVSSEGIMIDGEPNGYWKTYYKDGTIKSEGNRKDFKLDSTWKFYDQEGNLSMVINYKKGLKNGKRITYTEDEIKVDNFKDDIKHGWSKRFYPDSTLKRKVKYVDGKKDGFEKKYDKKGNIITLKEYDRGFLLNREFINRRDKKGRKQGEWKTFYENGNIKTSGSYVNGKKDGIFKKYDKDGGLLNIEKYKLGRKIKDDKEVAEYEIKRNFYDNGQVKTKATYLNDKMDGVRREYDKEGNITQSYVMDQGNVREKGGIVDNSGLKQGKWEEYYKSGQLRAKGKYVDGVKTGEWIYYFRNGEIEQRGKYNEEGKAEGTWRWYYPDGQLRKEEELKNGVSDGMYKEYTYEGELWAKGKYEDGKKEGSWIVSHRGYKEVGKYQNGVRQGEWKHYKNGELVYKGRFEDGLPDGKHVSYWYNGNKKKEGVYNMGEKNGEWRHYTKDGELLLVITYKFGKEVKYDNEEIKVAKEEQKE